MKTIEDINEFRVARTSLAAPVGFVPTMGYLHDGHLSLVSRARLECASVVASIFVNPTQFGPGEDLEAYPRDIPRDLQLLDKSGADFVWLPTVESLYPPSHQTWVTVEQITTPLEGLCRPSHFRGVTTIVAKLFNVVSPHKSYFGQKDAQQAAVIRRMVRDLNFPLEVVVCPTVREPDGLAMSSRNVYLNPKERRAAPVLYHALMEAKKTFEKGERRASKIRDTMKQEIQSEELADLQYVSCADPDSLQELEGPIEKALLSMAVVIGKTRLIDNIIIGE